MRAFSAMLLPLLLTASAAAQEVQIVENPIAEIVPETEIDGGVASYYGNELAGNRTASGERFDQHALTAAHRSLPFGTVVEVRNLENGATARVRINDRGPSPRDRIIDLSRAAAGKIGMLSTGSALVEVLPL